MNWKNADSNIFRGCSSLKSIVIPEGVTIIPDYAFQNADYIREVSLPSTLTKIGYSAFSGCEHLRYIDIPESVILVDRNAFSNCPLLRYAVINNANCEIGIKAFDNCVECTLVCHLYSFATIYAIDNDLKYSTMESSESSQEGLIDRSSTFYLAEINNLDANGYINFDLKYRISEEKWLKTAKHEMIFKVSEGTELIESSLRVGGNICTDYNYDEDELIVSIPIVEREGNIKFSSKAVENSDIRSYVLLSYLENSIEENEVVGVVDERVDIFTLHTDSITSSEIIKVEGVAPPETDVAIYVDNVLQANIKSNKVGVYQTQLKLQTNTDNQLFQLSSKCVDAAGKSLSASQSVKYQKNAPELTSFIFYPDGEKNQAVDLYGLSNEGIKPSITHTGSEKPFKFEIEFENPDMISNLYVTSTRSNIKKSIPAQYDENTGKFIAEGYFDEDNLLYVPGTIGIEYNLIHDNVLVGQDLDWDEWKNYLDEQLISGTKIESNPTEVGSEGTIDFSGVSDSFKDVMLNYSISIYNNSAGDVKDLIAMADITEKLYSYLVPGIDDSRYYAVLDLRDPETILMIVADVSKGFDDAIQFTLSSMQIGDSIGGVSYTDLFDLSSKLSLFSTGAGIAYEAYGIYSDYDKLCDDIMQSSTITDKSRALKQAEELRDNQMVFMLLTTLLPLVVMGGPMAGPTLMLTSLINSMSALSQVFWQLRIMQIKGGTYGIKWHIDPSGYVYDILTNERLEGVTVSAYCIEYDDTDDFWDRKPLDTEYGTLWEALSYNQANPLITDVEGRYAWDVPEGWWRVKYEKEGYETVWSDWLPVPPPQTEVNIGMIPEETEDAILEVNEKTFSDEIISHYESLGYTVAITNSQGEVTDVVGTGCNLVLSGKTYPIVVMGDVNGDGSIGVFDIYAMLAHINNTSKLTGVYLRAGCINGNRDIGVFDIYSELSYINGGTFNGQGAEK